MEFLGVGNLESNTKTDAAPGGDVGAFVESVLPQAERVAEKLGVPVDAVIGQWGLETGWGKSVIPGTHNYGNIKDVSGAGVAATDNMTGSRDRYRAYGSADEFADDFTTLLGNRRYAAVRGAADANSYFSALKAGGYAEDPDYVTKGAKAAGMVAQARGGKGSPASGVDPAILNATWMNPEASAAPAAPAPAAQKKERTWGQAAADTGAQLAEGVNNILGAVPNLVAPEGRAAQLFNDNAEYWRDKQSEPLKERIAQSDKAISKAGEDGVLAQIAEAASQYFSDPALAARFVVTNLPSMIPSIGAAKLAQAAALARGATAAKAAGAATTAAGATNAALNAGGARGEAFEDIKKTLIQQGMSPEQAEGLAIKDSRVVAGVGALAGFVSGKTGLEKALVGQGAKGGVRAGIAAGAKELAGEQIEEVAPKMATNVQAGAYDNRPLGQDVGRTIVETAIGSGPGGVVAGIAQGAGGSEPSAEGQIKRGADNPLFAKPREESPQAEAESPQAPTAEAPAEAAPQPEQASEATPEASTASTDVPDMSESAPNIDTSAPAAAAADSESDVALAEHPPAAPQAEAPKAPRLTAGQIAGHARKRALDLMALDERTPEQEAEYEFLTQNAGNPDAIAQAYGIEMVDSLSKAGGSAGKSKFARPSNAAPTDAAPVDPEQQQRIDWLNRVAPEANFKPFVEPADLPESDLGKRNRAAARQLAQLFNREAVFFDHKDTAPERFQVDGVSDGKAILLDGKSKRPLTFVFGHELTHDMRTNAPDLYDALVGEIAPKADLDAYMRDWRRANQDRAANGMSDDRVTEEFVGDLVGRRMHEKRFWEEMARRHPGKFQKVAKHITDFISKVITLINGTPDSYLKDAAKDLEAVRSAIADALFAYQARSTAEQEQALAELAPAERKAVDAMVEAYQANPEAMDAAVEQAETVEDLTQAATEIVNESEDQEAGDAGEVDSTEQQPAAVTEDEAGNAEPANQPDAPGSAEPAPQVAPAPRTVSINGRKVTLTPAQAEQWDAAKAAHDAALDAARQAYERTQGAPKSGDPDVGYRSPKERFEARKKELGLKLSAERRKIAGAMTEKEKAKADADAKKIRKGDRVRATVDDRKITGTVAGLAFGKVRIDAGDGVVAVPHADVTKLDAETTAIAPDVKTSEPKPAPAEVAPVPTTEPAGAEGAEKVAEGPEESVVAAAKAVVASVFSPRHNRQVREAIVELVPVDVMDDLTAGKFSANVFLDNPSVLTDADSVSGAELSVALARFGRALEDGMASHGAEVLRRLPEAGRALHEIASTLAAFDSQLFRPGIPVALDRAEVAEPDGGPISLPLEAGAATVAGDADALDHGGVSAGPRAKVAPRSNLRRDPGKAAAADSASNSSQGSPPKKKSSIPDQIGEKIGGARKDVWTSFKDDLSAVADDAIADQPLSKVWPAPDYQKLIDGGTDAEAVAVVRALRDEVPAKPRASWKVKRWAEQVKTLRSLASDILEGKTSAAEMRRKMARIGSLLKGIAGRIDLYMEVGHAKSLEGIRFRENHYFLYKGQQNVTMWVIEKDAAATAFSNWPREIATGKTREEAIADFKAKYDKLDADKLDKQPSFDIFAERGAGGFFIGKKIGRNYAKLEGPFKTLKEARQYRDQNVTALQDKLEKFKEIPRERRDVNEPRVGADMRNAQDVTPEMFAETFKFRGVEFGNWVEQKRRQQDLNDAFDALMDMAAILDIPPAAISLNGKLGLAFGARGSGGVNPAAAHYERGKVVINLTKRAGAGSLGHEWWHALDNYFSRMRGNGGEMMTDALDVSLAARGAKYEHRGEVREEMVEAFGAVMKAIRSTAIKTRSSKLDAKRTKEYWTTGPEMSARAFESYLIAKLQDQNASNDYLANIVSEATWKASEKLGFELGDSYPYPTAGEIPAIRAAFDHFFETVEAREAEDRNVALYSRKSDDPAPSFLRRSVISEPRFKSWFGASAIVDEAGMPRKVYHGTDSDIEAFDLGKAGSNIDSGWLGAGIYLTSDPDVARYYAEQGRKGTANVMPLYASIKNPFMWGKKNKGVRGEIFGEASIPARIRDAVLKRANFQAAEEPDFSQEPALSRALRDELIAQGYDGVVANVGNDIEIVAFEPSQIKSAVGNNGNYDPADDRIAFLRKDVTEKVANAINDLTKTQKVFNWWHRTVGTQYHKAQKHAGFKAVFDGVQKYLADTTQLAMQSEAMAPDILPKMDTLKDLGLDLARIAKNRSFDSLKKADREPLAKAVYTGTLEKRVWTDAELRDQFGATDQQIRHYRQYLAAINDSLDSLAKSEIVRLAKLADMPGADSLMELSVANAAGAVEDALNDAARDKLLAYLQKMAKGNFYPRPAFLEWAESEPSALAIAERFAKDYSPIKDQVANVNEITKTVRAAHAVAAQNAKLQQEGYVPLMRFGRHFVHVKDADGNTQFFSMFESEAQANKLARELAAEDDSWIVQQGVTSLEQHKLFKGVNPETMALFAQASGVPLDDMMQQYFKLAAGNASTMRRLIHRKGTAGYSEDVTRGLASFIISNARRASANINQGDIDHAAKAIREGDVKDEAIRLKEYVQNPAEEAGRLRGFMFAYFIGGSVASAAVNMTQPVMMTYPKLAEFGAGKAAKALTAAMGMAGKAATGAKLKISDPALAAAVKRAEAEGVVAPQEIFQLMATASGAGIGSKAAARAQKLWGSFFSVAESFNRYSTFIAAFDLASAAGRKNPYDYAVNAVYDTQGLYNKGNRPNWARGAVGATLFTFKQFSVAYLEFLVRLPRKQQMIALGLLMLAAGADGLPFADDIEDLIDALAGKLGYAWHTKAQKRKFLEDALGVAGANFVTRGISAFIPFDISGRLSVSNLVPGTGALSPARQDKAEEVAEVLGASGGMLKAAGALYEGRFAEAMPVAIANFYKGLQIARTGEIRNAKGAKVADAKPGDAASKMIGFNPNTAAEASRIQGMNFANLQIQKAKKKDIMDAWVEAIVEKDKAGQDKARRELKEWNEKNGKTMPILINPASLARAVQERRMTWDQRQMKRTSKEMRPHLMRAEE